ncbi:MAG: AbrB family transcriptional regulator [Pseudoruegeria sp.]
MFTRARILTVIIASFGTVVFWGLGLPLSFLFGPMFACLIAALCGAKLEGFGQISVAARTILGVAVGAAITPDVVDQLPQMALSVALIPVFIFLSGLIGLPFFHRICGFDRATAYYAAMPGGLQDMVVFGQEAGGDVRALSLIHATRVLILVSLAPILMTTLLGASLDNPLGAPLQDLPFSEMLLMIAAALIGWKGGERIGLFGASILGPMILTATLSLTGFIHTRPPAEAILTAQFLLGSAIGAFYVGVTLKELRNTVVSAVVFVLILAMVATVLAEILVLAGFAQPLEAFLAFFPGGQAEVTMLAIVAGADLGFVIVHHLTRIIVVIVGAPIMANLLFKDRNIS